MDFSSFGAIYEIHVLILVGIERDPNISPNPISVINRQEQKKIAVKEKAEELCLRFRVTSSFECSLEDSGSILNVFQSAIEAVHPRFQLI
ncbi:hypothetical protein AVEN_101626-1 [Araneus ventricosus]|uniref:Uncharacterized protein n=1 Tax=Araneus ventricosus TaxID=182803 RepID=A0A4Y2EWQ0_ARAVE|nr:hypothetical protein AVEN_101626-1 [Araneus ventricosus]